MGAGEAARKPRSSGEVAPGPPSGGEAASRTPSPADLAALCHLDAACFEAPWSPAVWEQELAAADRRWRVVPAPGGGLVAMGGLWLAPDEAHVLRLAVAPGSRRQGLGDRLLADLVAVAAEAGRAALTLEVRASNRAAVSLYRRHEFVVEGVRAGYYPDGEDAVILWRHAPDRVARADRK